MKKTLLLLASAAMLLVGCAKEKFAEPIDGGLTNVTFTASLENGVATKSADDGDGAAASVNRCIMEIYYGGERYTRQYAPVNGQKKATFTVQVVSNRKYKVAFWADKVDATTEAGLQLDKYYTTNAEGQGLQAIAIKGSYIGNDDARDAFYHVGEYTVEQAGTSFPDIKLKRPFAQVNVITTDWDKVSVPVAALAPEKVNVTVKNALVAFNAVTGEASGSQTLNYEAAVYTPAAHGAEKTLSMDYLFAPADKAVIDIDWKALHGEDTPVAHSFAAVPYQRNYRTNIKGALLTTTGQWTVTVEPTWASGNSGENDYNVYYTTVNEASEVKGAIAEKTNDESKAGQPISVTINNEVGTGESNDDIIIPDNTPKVKTPEIILDFKQLSATAQIVIRDEKHPVDQPVADDANEYYGEVIVIVPEGTTADQVKILTNKSTVTVRGEYGTVIASCAPQTIIVEKETVIGTLEVMKGNVEVYGKVTSIVNKTALAPADKDVVYVYLFQGSTWTNVESEKSDILVPLYPVAKIGSKYYFSLENAIETVGDGQTIEVITDVANAAGISVPSGKNFTVDFGGHTYAMECPGAGSAGTKTAGFQLLKNSTIVFKNGTIKCTDANKDKTWSSGDASKGIAIMIQNYANLTLEDITINATNIAHNGAAVRYALSNNSGNVEYKGNTTITTKSGDYAFDVCKNGSYPEPTVTWNSTGTVTGGIELTGGEFIVAKDLVLSDPIMTMDAAAKLTVNASITPVTGWTYGTTRDALVIIKRTGNLTVNGTGKISSNNVEYVYAAVKMTNYGESETGDAAKLTVNGTVTLEGLYYGICGNGSRQNTEITLNSGTIKGTAENDNVGIYHPQAGKLTIKGGTVEGSTGLALKGGELVVEGGTIKGNGQKGEFSHHGSGWNNTGDALAVEVCDYPGQNPPQSAMSVNIKGGKFTSANGEVVASYVQPDKGYAPLTGFISGGLYNTEPDADYIVAGKKAEQNEQGYWEIVIDELAIVNGVKYATVGEAIDAATTGDVINVYGTTDFTKADDGFCYTDATNKKGRLVLVELVDAGSPSKNATLWVNTAPSVNSMTFQTLWGNSASRLHNPGSYLNSGDVIVLPAKTIYIEDQSTIYDVYGDITFLGKKGKTVIKPWQTSASSYRFLRLYNRYKKNITDNVIYHYNFKDVIFDGSLEKHTSANLFVVTCYNIQINMDGCTVTDFPGSVFSIWANDTLYDNSSYPTREDNVGVEVNITNSSLTGNGRLVHYDCSPYQDRDINAGLDRYAFIHVNYDNNCTLSNTEQYSVNASTAKGQGNCLLNGVDVWPADN